MILTVALKCVGNIQIFSQLALEINSSMRKELESIVCIFCSRLGLKNIIITIHFIIIFCLTFLTVQFKDTETLNLSLYIYLQVNLNLLH